MKFEGFKYFVRNCANKLGIDITRYRPATTEVGRLSAMLGHHGVDLVFDVGANTGQFATALRTAGYVGTIVSFEPLSSAPASEYCDADARIFTKIDTQGFESLVLDRATKILRRATGVQLELSLLPLYENQKLYDELMDRIRQLGFTPWAIWPALFDSKTGRIMQADATFFRD